MIFYNTIDLDNCDKEKLERITSKIKEKKCCLELQSKPSFSKGYHILLVCDKKCFLCRMVFDDPKRFEMDSNRDLKYQNTLFDSKEYTRGSIKNLKNTCDRCIKYGNLQFLKEKKLTLLQTKEKLRNGKLEDFPVKIVYLGYTYYECPVCGWFKFVKIGEYKYVS